MAAAAEVLPGGQDCKFLLHNRLEIFLPALDKETDR